MEILHPHCRRFVDGAPGWPGALSVGDRSAVDKRRTPDLTPRPFPTREGESAGAGAIANALPPAKFPLPASGRGRGGQVRPMMVLPISWLAVVSDQPGILG